MIPVPRPKEPPNFKAQVRRPGKKWLDSGSEARPPSYWLRVRDELAEAFKNRCGYTAMLDLNGTVDHFEPQSGNRSKLYEWNNFRYASGWINSSKQSNEDIIDPYDVGEGWFEVQLPSLQLVASMGVPDDKKALVQTTLNRLPIARDVRVIRQRQAWLESYENGIITLDGLYQFAPLIAAAVEKKSAKKKPARKKPAKKKPAKKKPTKKKPTKRKPT